MRFQRYKVGLYAAIFSFLIVAFSFRTYAADIKGGTYFTVDTTQLGKVKIYINPSYREYFGLVNGVPSFMSTGTNSGYILDNQGAVWYRVTIGSFGDTWTYRNVNQSYSYTLNVTGYYPEESNIFVAGTDLSDEKWLLYSVVFLGGCIIVTLWFKR